MMVRVFHFQDAETNNRSGYNARYFADIQFTRKLDTAGFIFITIPSNSKTEPHAHMILEEIFIALTPLKMRVNGKELKLDTGDLVVVEPNESHSIQNHTSKEGRMLAIKFPNVKDDKVSADD